MSKLKRQKKADLKKVAPSQRHKKDDAAYFDLVGGPHHGNRVRLYAPWDVLVYGNGVRYELHPPVAKSGEWVYIHNMEGQ